MKRAIQIVCLAAIVAVFGSTASALQIETVPVGNPGNLADDTGYGTVDYEYGIGKYEVTAGQYRQFLNAVAATDTYGLYNPNMNTDEFSCQITQNGVSGEYTYDFSGGTAEAPGSTADDWENRPVDFVNWGDAARFVNWLHNGQPTGKQDVETTEDGAYFLNGATSLVGLGAILREADATYAIPSDDEWYKAAYHKNDGVTGNYFDYPTSSDSIPSNDLVDPDPGNNATFYASGRTIGRPYYRTEVGAHENSDSPYGTFDQGGNVWELNEGIIDPDGKPYRVLRGGSYHYDRENAMRASYRLLGNSTSEYSNLGFRVVEVPEPTTLSLLALGGLAVLRRRRRR